jgi:hypothetical protein
LTLFILCASSLNCSIMATTTFRWTELHTTTTYRWTELHEDVVNDAGTCRSNIRLYICIKCAGVNVVNE